MPATQLRWPGRSGSSVAVGPARARRSRRPARRRAPRRSAPTIVCGPTRDRPAAHLYRLRQREDPERPSTSAIRRSDRRVDVWYGAGALWKSISEPDDEADQARRPSARRGVTTCASITSSAAPRISRPRPVQLSRQDREAEQRSQQRDGPERAGQHDARDGRSRSRARRCPRGRAARGCSGRSARSAGA